MIFLASTATLGLSTRDSLVAVVARQKSRSVLTNKINIRRVGREVAIKVVCARDYIPC